MLRVGVQLCDRSGRWWLGGSWGQALSRLRCWEVRVRVLQGWRSAWGLGWALEFWFREYGHALTLSVPMGMCAVGWVGLTWTGVSFCANVLCGVCAGMLLLHAGWFGGLCVISDAGVFALAGRACVARCLALLQGGPAWGAVGLSGACGSGVGAREVGELGGRLGGRLGVFVSACVWGLGLLVFTACPGMAGVPSGVAVGRAVGGRVGDLRSGVVDVWVFAWVGDYGGGGLGVAVLGVGT
ncbi:hypothetical protein Tco_1447320 [Tanacetum coccineum]